VNFSYIFYGGDIMEITRGQVKHVALLAKLKFTGEEEEGLAEHMKNIINLAHKLNELDTQGVEPTAHVLALKNVFREDEVQTSLSQEEILANAPLHENGCFKVPRVVE